MAALVVEEETVESEADSGKKDIIKLFKCIDILLVLPKKLELKFKRDMVNFEKELNVSYVCSFEKLSKEEGFIEGEQKGIKKGESSMLIFQLKNKFKRIPKKYIQRVQKANPDILMVWAKRILTADTLKGIFEV